LNEQVEIFVINNNCGPHSYGWRSTTTFSKSKEGFTIGESFRVLVIFKSNSYNITAKRYTTKLVFKKHSSAIS